MSIGDSITQPIPVVSEAGTGYATKLVNFLGEVKARLEAKVPLTSLLAGLFDLSNNPIANASYVSLYEQTEVPTTPVGSLQNYGGEAYYVSPDGAVRITNNGSLDIVSANGITGDYAAPAEFQYSLGDTAYYAFSDTDASPDEWAYVGARAFDIYGTLDSTTRVRLGWVGGSSYAFTLPAALPGAQAVVQVEADGDVVFSNTLGDLTTGTLATGAITVNTNTDVTVSGTGKYKHGQRVIHASVPNTQSIASGPGLSRAAGTPVVTVSSGETFHALPMFPSDWVIENVRVVMSAAPGASVTFSLVEATTVFNAAIATDSGNKTAYDLAPAGGLSMVGVGPLWVRLQTGGTSTSFYEFEITYHV